VHRLRRQHPRDWLCLLALAGVLLRGLLPAGFMPQRVDGHLSMVFCVGGQLHADPAHPGTLQLQSCPFAAAAMPVSLAALPRLEASLDNGRHELPTTIPTATRRRAPLPPPARGPPHFSMT